LTALAAARSARESPPDDGALDRPFLAAGLRRISDERAREHRSEAVGRFCASSLEILLSVERIAPIAHTT
jgi:hypothetical protein